MHINWIAYYMQQDGYGRYSSRMVRALQRLTTVKAATMDHREMPAWMQRQEGINWNGLTISFLPPYYLKSVPGRHWLYSMTEGSRIPDSWVRTINDSNVERVLVPCEHNKKAFETSGVAVPVSVAPGGTDPLEFPYTGKGRPGASSQPNQPYTFLTLADRGFRKGWNEVWDAFYIAFGGKTTGRQDVRLRIKARPQRTNSTLSIMMNAGERDKRIIYDISEPVEIREVYAEADCLALPSRSEGWGMPHREAAMSGLPVIAQHYAGLDEPLANLWCYDVPGKLKPIPKEAATQIGEWRVADKQALAEKMVWCVENRQQAAEFGHNAGRWLGRTQTWMHAAHGVMDLIGKHG